MKNKFRTNTAKPDLFNPFILICLIIIADLLAFFIKLFNCLKPTLKSN